MRVVRSETNKVVTWEWGSKICVKCLKYYYKRCQCDYINVRMGLYDSGLHLWVTSNSGNQYEVDYMT